MDISLLLSVHICFSVDLGLPDFTMSDFEVWALVTWGTEKKTSVSWIEMCLMRWCPRYIMSSLKYLYIARLIKPVWLQQV